MHTTHQKHQFITRYTYTIHCKFALLNLLHINIFANFIVVQQSGTRLSDLTHPISQIIGIVLLFPCHYYVTDNTTCMNVLFLYKNFKVLIWDINLTVGLLIMLVTRDTFSLWKINKFTRWDQIHLVIPSLVTNNL